MDKKLNENRENLIPMKLINCTVQTYNTINTNIPYNQPAFLAVNNGYTSLYALSRIPY